MQWHQPDHMQTICTLLQTDNHTNTSSLNFYRPGALPEVQPTVSKHWRQKRYEVSLLSFSAALMMRLTTDDIDKHWEMKDNVYSCLLPFLITRTKDCYTNTSTKTILPNAAQKNEECRNTPTKIMCFTHVYEQDKYNHINITSHGWH